MATKSLKDLKQEYAPTFSSKTADSKSILDLKRQYNAANVAKDIQSRLTKLGKDSQSLLGGYNSRFFDKDGKYITDVYRSSEDAGNWLYDVETQREALETEGSEIKKLLADYGEYFDKDMAANINSILDGNVKVINGIVSNSLMDKEYWDKFETEDEYNEAVQTQKNYDEMASANLLAIGKEILDKKSILKQAKKLESSPSNVETETKRPTASRGGISYTVDDNGNYTLPPNKENAELINFLKENGYSSIDELETDISNRGAYYKQAERIQEGIKYAGVADPESKYYDPNFNKYVEMGKTYYDSNHPDSPSVPNVNFDQKGYRADTAEAVGEYAKQLDSFEYTNMTNDEREIYHYYLGKAYEESNGGKVSEETAEKYVNLITDAINARHAEKMAKDFANEGKLTQLAFSLYSGLESWTTGVENFFNFSDEYIPQTATALASQMVREDMAEDGWGWKVAYDIGNTTANMFPSIALSYVPFVGQGLSLASTGISAAGHAYTEALNNGYSKEQARGYSVLVGGSEAGLQYLLGGISRLGGKLTKGAVSKLATKATANIGKAYAKIAVSSGIKLVGSMASEFGEEYLQEVLTPVFKNIALDTNEEVKLFSTDALYAGFLGALSAGLLEGVGTVSGEIGTYKAGKSVIEKGQVDALAKLGTSFSADSVAHKIASKVNDKTDAYTLGQLLREVGADHLSAENIADITAELERRGMSLNDAQSIAKWLNKGIEGEGFTEAQISALKNNEIISEVFFDVVFNKNSSVNQRNKEYQAILKAIDKNETNTTTDATATEKTEEQLSAPDTSKLSVVDETLAESKFEVSDDGKTINLKTDKEVNISKIDSISESGEANLTLDDGMVVKASDVAFGSPVERALIEGIGDIKIGKSHISTDSANALYQAAMTEWKSNPDMTAGEAVSLVKGLAESYVYGAYNFGEDRLTATNEDGSAKYFAGELSQTQRKFAYELGTKDSIAKVEADQKVIDDIKAKADPKAKNKHLGKVIFEGDIAVDELGLTDTQKANLDGIKLLADTSNIEFHVFMSDENLKFTLPDGAVRSANGWYVSGTNEIWIDLKAGNFGQGTMLWTAGHEISHYIKQWSPAQWKAMADLIFDTFAKNDVNIESMMNKQKAKIRKRYNKKNMPSEAKLTDMAYEEFVSDALTNMLTDGSIVNFIAEVKQKNKSLTKKILDAIKNLLSKWGLIIDDYKGRDLEVEEAQALSQFEDTFKKLQEMYQEALMDADATYSAMHSLNAEQINTLTEAGIGVDDVTGEVFSIRDSFATNDKITIGKKSFDIEAVATLVSEVTGRSIEDARKWVNSEMTIANLVMKNPEFLDFEADDRYEAIKKNSDYPQGTVDLSNLCPKRQEFTSMFDMLQRKYPNKLFTAEDVAEMRNILSENGLTVACGACFVEDRRQLLGEIADTYINMWKEAVETGKPLQKTNAKGDKVKLTVTSALAKQYGVTKGTDILATDTYIPTQYDLTTYEGFRLLEKNHPTIAMGFNRYNNSRGQQSGRLIEGRAEYKRQILGWSDAKVKSVNNNGGLRIFSFSDFEVVHLLDLVQVIIDCSAKGVKIQGYTKSPTFAKLVRNTGIKLNRSFIPKGDTGIKVVDGKRVLDIDAVEGIDYNDENFLDEADNPDVGNVIIGINPEQIGIAFIDDNIDYIIPFHSNKAKDILKKLGLESWVNYKESQHEKDISTGKASKHNVNIYTQVINKYHPTNKVEFVEAFLKECKRQGKIPRYSEFLNVDANGDYAYREGYHKLLVDFKMFDKDGNILPQGQITPNLDNAFMTEILNAEVDKKANYEFPKEVYDQIEEKFGGETLFSERKQKVDDAVDKAIKQKGSLGEKYNQVQISEFPPDVSKFVSSASEGRIDLKGKYIAVKGDDIWHEYKRHNDASTEADRNQLPLTADTIKEAIMAIYSPDVVESLFSTTQNPTQRQSFAYAKKSPNGYYIVVEAVGGRRNPNVIPVMLLQFTEEKWDKMISSGMSLGELLFENDAEKRNSLDVELNKKNRVTVAQFASKEAIANTPRSPQFDNIIPQIDDSVNMHSDRDYVETDSKAVMTTERIDYLIEDSGAGSRKDYAQSWIARISPTDYLNLTTSERVQDREVFDQFGSEWDENVNMTNYDYLGQLKKSIRQTPYLRIDINTGEVLGHDGRHRIRALEMNGIKSVEIKVEFYDSDGDLVKYEPNGKRWESIKQKLLTNQFGTKQTATAFDLIPLNEDHRREIEATYGENANTDASVNYSDRDTSTSNRTILANSLESAAQNDIERNKLAQYKEKISLIEAEEQRLSEIQKKLFTKGGVDPKQRKELQFEAKQISNRINTYDRQLLNLESTTALKNVLNREKSRAMKRQKQKDTEALNRYKEKVAKTQRELLERHQESRRKATEGRNKTAMRHKIQSVVSELNTLLTHGNKKKHVPEDLKVAVAEVLELFNMDTVGAEERVAKYDALIAKAKDPDVIASLTETRDRIQTQGDKFNARLMKLKSAYDTIKSSADPEMAGGFDEVISSRIEYVASIVGKTPLRNMTLEQLDAVHDVYTMVLNNIREANALFKKDKAETIQNYASRVVGEVKQAGGEHEFTSPRTSKIKEFLWNNLKPIFAFEKIGSKTLTDLFEDVRKGEDTWAVDITDAKSFADSEYEKYNYKKWDFDKKYTFKSTTGEQFSLTLDQMLSLYAYSKRPQAGDHLRIGGFVFDDSITTYKEKENGKQSVLKYNVNIAKAHQISINTLADIIGNLTEEQKGFVDEMQTYLSDVMGAKGNEVSMTLYNIRLFKEKNYFPLKSAKQFMFEQNEVAGEVKIKNSGFTESTVEHANNPIILNNFMDVWANHVNDMSMYHSFVVPLENFSRVFNYQTRRAEGMPPVSVKEILQNAYGTHAVSYIRQLLTDLNGGARSDPRESTAKKLLSTFKKAKVFTSASVVIQQPSAVARALAFIDAKYFDFNPKLIKHKERWEELKKYAPVAIIKEMGRFDTDMGLSTVEYIKDQKTLMQKAEDWLSKAPAYADELVWVHIWEAVKRETKAKHPDLKVGSEEFLKTAGERFTEVISKTQVYDSVLSKSANMRSKSGLMAMMTAFMAEPTTSINMVEQGLRLWKRGYKRLALKQLKGVGASIILNSALVSLIYAMRDDDEDETYLEKYLGSFVSETVDGFNPLTYFPIVKDVWSLLQGYDVERSDMSLFSDAIDSLSDITKTLASYDEDMTDEEAQKFKDDMVSSSLKLVDGVAALFGIPVGNIRRDINSIINTYKTVTNGASTSGTSLKNELTESVKDTTPVWGWLPDKQKSDKLYEAIMEKDTAYVDRLKSGYKDDKAYETALRKALRENDPRIKEAAEARFNGDFDEYERLFEEIKGEGNFGFDTIMSAVNTEYNKLGDSNDNETSNDSTDVDKVESIYKTSDINAAFENGDTSSALEIIDDIVKVKTENYINEGEKEKDAEAKAKSSVKSSMTSYWKPLYIAAYNNKDNAEMARIRKILLSSGLYGRTNDVVKTGQDWVKNSKK